MNNSTRAPQHAGSLDPPELSLVEFCQLVDFLLDIVSLVRLFCLFFFLCLSLLSLFVGFCLFFPIFPPFFLFPCPCPFLPLSFFLMSISHFLSLLFLHYGFLLLSNPFLFSLNFPSHFHLVLVSLLSVFLCLPSMSVFFSICHFCLCHYSVFLPFL